MMELTGGNVELASFGAFLTILGVAFVAFSIFRAFSNKTKIFGPRLEDRKVQVSTYGNTIKRLYGCDRVAGNVIWSSEIKEVRKKSGGKSFGGGAEVTEFHYFVDFAVSLGSIYTPETADVMRIWLDADLAFDRQDPAVGTFLGVPQFGHKIWRAMRVYSGAEDQEADPLMQAALGIDNVPAYRGQIMIVFESLEITKYGRIPNVTAEVCSNAQEAFPVDTAGSIAQNNMQIFVNPFVNAAFFVWHSLGELRIIKYDLVTGDVVEGIAGGFVTNSPPVGMVMDSIGNMWHGARHAVLEINPYNLAAFYIPLPATTNCRDGVPVTPGRTTAIAAVPRIGKKDSIIAFSRRWYHVLLNSFTPVNWDEVDGSDPTSAAVFARWSGGTAIICGAIWDGFPGATRCDLFQMFASETLLDACPPSGGSIPIFKTPVTGIIREVQALGVNPDGTELYALGVNPTNRTINRLAAFSIGAFFTLLRTFDETSIPNGGKISNAVYGDGLQLQQGLNWPVFMATGGTQFTRIDLSTFTITGQQAKAGFGLAPFIPTSTNYVPFLNSVLMSGNADEIYHVFLDRSARGPVLLRDIIADISSISGLDLANDIDVAGLTDLVRGLTLQQRSPAASHLEMLLASYIVDATESDWRVRFVKRGSRSYTDLPAFMQTIEQKYLGAKQEEGQDYVLERKMIQDRERPRRIDVRYPDVDQDFLEGDQHASRTVIPEPAMFSQMESTTEIPVVFNADEAKQVAESWLQLAWSETQSLELVALPRLLLLDPTDVVIVESPSGTDLVRIEEYDFGADLGVEMKTVTHVVPASILGGAPALGFIPSILPTPALAIVTTSEILDIPLLRDEDTFGVGTGPYIALQTQAVTWPGANVFVSANDINYVLLAGGNEKAIWGITEDSVPAPDHFTVWDDENTIQVFMPNGDTLASAADDIAVLNGANAAVIGKEVIQWRDATVDPGEPRRFTLSRLLRGRRGTNTFMNHPPGERFILLSEDTILREQMSLSDINAVRYFKTVTTGGSLALVNPRALTYEANDLKPYSPAHIRGDLDGSNNLTIRWLRRTRIGGDLGWSNPAVNGNVPLSEASERYEVEILSGPGGSVVRTINSGITISAAPATDEFNGRIVYSAADQTADGLTPGGPVTVRIYQMSEIVGRGFPAERTI